MDEVKGIDFSDEEFGRFFESVERLEWKETAPTDESIHRAAEAFSRDPPMPGHDQMRSHIDHSVTVSRGWDHPYDRRLMFDTAVKSFYILAWLEYLQEQGRGDGGQSKPVDLTLGVKVTFTPVFRGA